MKHMLRALRWILLLIVGLVLLVAGAAWYAVGTRHGSRLVTTQLLTRAVKAQRLSVGRIDGTLWGGLVLRAIEIDGLKGLPSGSRLKLQGVDAASLSRLASGGGLKLAMHHATLRIPQSGLTVSVNMVEGSLAGDWTLRDVAIEGLPRFPSERAVTIQQISVSPPLSLRHVRAIRNGKIPLQYSEPVVFSGSQKDGQLDAGVYSKAVDVQEALELVGVRRLRNVQGTITDVNLRVTGSIRHPVVAGEFMAAKLVHKGFAMIDCPGAVSLRLRNWRRDEQAGRPAVDVEGHLQIWAGSLAAKNAMIRLQPSRLVFDGELTKPSYDVRGVAAVEGITIHMSLKGTKEHPELRLTSEPSQPQEQLLLMLATGKSWGGADLLFTGNQIPVDLVRDFVDFAFFGGRGARLAHRLGISELSLVYDPQQRGVGVGTVLFNRVEADYELMQLPPEGPATGAQTQPATTHKIGAGYKLSTDSSITIEGEKTVESRTTAPEPATETAPAKLEESLFDKILLKYKRKF